MNGIDPSDRVEQLSDDARALIEATLDAYEPTASNRAQVRWGLESKLSSSPAPRLLARGRRSVVALAAAAIMLAGAGVAAALVWRATAPSTATSLESTTEPAGAAAEAPGRPRPVVAPSKHEDTAAATKPILPAASVRAAPRHRAQPAAHGDLAGEISLIARAQAATNRGHGDRALQLLEQYERKFGSGALAEEHAAARVFALCAAGNPAAARAEAAQFLQRWPRSPQAGRVGSACRAEPDRP